jgi:hypothetical protein
MEFGNQSMPMVAHDNARGGLQVQPGAEPKALSAGRNVGKRHGKSSPEHDMQDTNAIISSVDCLCGEKMTA